MVLPSGALDVHQHYGTMDSIALPEGDGGRAAAPEQWAQTERRVRLATMAEMGISRAAVLASNSYLRPDGIADTRLVNDGIAAYCAADPERFPIGIATVEPLHGPAGLAEIRRVADLGLRGVAYHTRFQGVSIDSVWVRRHLELVGELGLVPLIHINVDSSLESPLLLLRIAKDFPGLPIVALDGLASHQHTIECELLAETCPEVLFETSQAYGNVVSAFVARFGSKRVVFGSDLNSYPLSWRTGNSPSALAAMIADPDEAADVLWRNASRLFGLPEPDAGTGGQPNAGRAIRRSHAG